MKEMKILLQNHRNRFRLLTESGHRFTDNDLSNMQMEIIELLEKEV